MKAMRRRNYLKKLFYLLLVVLLIGALAACGNDNEKAKNKNKDDESITVDKNLLSVEITIPASMLELQEKDIDQVIAEAKKDGIKEVIKNNDGSLTYKMSKSKHKELMKEMENDLIDVIDEIKTSGDFTSIQDIKYNKSFSEFTILVNREAFENSFDGLASLSLGISGMFYQLFDGVSPDENKVTIAVEDVDTGEIIDTIVYPDTLKEALSEE